MAQPQKDWRTQLFKKGLPLFSPFSLIMDIIYEYNFTENTASDDSAFLHLGTQYHVSLYCISSLESFDYECCDLILSNAVLPPPYLRPGMHHLVLRPHGRLPSFPGLVCLSPATRFSVVWGGGVFLVAWGGFAIVAVTMFNADVTIREGGNLGRRQALVTLRVPRGVPRDYQGSRGEMLRSFQAAVSSAVACLNSASFSPCALRKASLNMLASANKALVPPK